MRTPSLLLPVLRPLAAGLLSSGALLLAACSIQADLPTDKALVASDLASRQSLTAKRHDSWPVARWWQRYGDRQLDTLMTQALAGSPSLAMAQARLDQARGMARQAGALQGPEIGANASVSEQKLSYHNGNDFVPRDWNTYGSATLNFSYELDFWGKNRALVEAASSELAAAEAVNADARRLLTSSVAQAYAELAHLYANRDTAQTALQIRQQTVTLFRQRYRNGLETLGSVRQVESLQATAAAELLAVDEAIVLQGHALAALLGQGPDRALEIHRPTLPLDARFGLPEGASADLLGHRPDVTAARWRAEAAARQVGVAQTRFYPDISLSGFIGTQAMGLENLGNSGSEAGGITPALYLPLFTSGRLDGQLESARASYQQAVNGYNATVVQAFMQVANAVTSAKALDGRLTKSQEAVTAADDAYQIANRRYRGGLATYLDVLSAESALLASRQALVNMQARALSLDIELVHALGGGAGVAKATNDVRS